MTVELVTVELATADSVTVGTVEKFDVAEFDEKHRKKLDELELKVTEATENSGDMEVLDARLEVARFAAMTCSKDIALEMYQKVLELPKLSSGKTLDALMESARVASFHNDTTKNVSFIERVSVSQGCCLLETS